MMLFISVCNYSDNLPLTIEALPCANRYVIKYIKLVIMWILM